MMSSDELQFSIFMSVVNLFVFYTRETRIHKLFNFKGNRKLSFVFGVQCQMEVNGKYLTDVFPVVPSSLHVMKFFCCGISGSCSTIL